MPDNRQREWKEIILTLTRNEITFAVDFETAKVAQVLASSAEKEKQRRVSDFQTSEQTKDWFDQQVVSAVAELMSTAGNMAYRLQTTTADDRVDWKRTEWNIIVHVSPRWLGTPEQAARFATDYVSAYCLARWYTMVDPARAATYETRASRCAAKFRDVITRSFVPTQFW